MQPGGVATKVASGIRRVRLTWMFRTMAVVAVLGMHCGLVAQTDPAQSPVSKPLYKVAPTATFALKDEKRSKTLEMTVVWPQAPLEANAKSPAQFPLVVFSHGLGGSDEAFPFLADYLAARGYVVIRPTHADSAKYMKTPGEFIRDPRASAKKLDLQDRVQDLVFILDSLAAIEKGPLGGGGVGENILIDRARIAAAGHSAGALTTMLATGTQARALNKTVASYAAGIKSIAEPRFKAGVVISGAGLKNKMLSEDSWNKVLVPLIFFDGSLDTSKASDETPESRKDGFKYSRGTVGGGPPAWLVFIQGATHSSYGGKTKALTLDAGAMDPTDPQLVSAITNETTFEFLEASLNGSQSAKDWLANPKNLQTLGQGKATIQTK